MITTPCAFCGYPDAQHRVWDAIRSRYQAGESIGSLMHDYGLSREAIGTLVEVVVQSLLNHVTEEEG